MSDLNEIDNLLEAIASGNVGDWDWANYISDDWQFINDLNGTGGYSSGQINFDTLSIAQKQIVHRDSYISVPLQIVSSTGTAYTASTPIAWKWSGLSACMGVNVQDQNGTSLFNDQNGVYYINNLRRLVEEDTNWYNTEGAEILFSRSGPTYTGSDVNWSGNAIGTNVQQFATTNTTYYVAASSGGSPTTAISTAGIPSFPSSASTVSNSQSNTAYNSGFDQGVRYFKSQFQFVSGGPAGAGFYGNLNIPVRYLHEFFDRMDFPITNMRFFFNFFMAFPNLLSQFMPLVVGDGASAPLITIGPGGATSTNTCRYYYRAVKLPEQVAAALAKKMKEGFSVKVEFRVTDYYGSALFNSTATQVSPMINQSVVKPLKVWVLQPPAGNTASSSQWPVYTSSLTGCNILVNNQNYYTNLLSQPWEFWDVLKQQFPKAGASDLYGSLINYQDFLTTLRLQCLDISRQKERIAAPNLPVSIQLMGNRADTASNACDYIILTERLTAVKFMFSEGAVAVVIGPNV